MKPSASTSYNPDPAYIRALFQSTALSQRELAERLGISARAIRYAMDSKAAPGRRASYPIQFALECLAGKAETDYAKARQ
jgi:transcriptional regulator with XRE-family HTH domain